MPLDENEFKFPDEAQEEPVQPEAKQEIEIEIEDDTPEEDRGRKPLPKPLAEELEKDELEQYDDTVKTKLKQMRKVWHDERREKEAALREQQEAIDLARRLLDENNRIRNLLNTGEKEFINMAQSAAETELKAAQKSFKEAYDSGDADKLVEAQQAMQMANMKLLQAKNFKPTALQPQETVVQTPQIQSPSVPRPDPKAVAWQERNQWFGQDDEMTAAAYGLHEKLKKTGIIIGSDEYYAALDRTMRKRFPEAFDEETTEQPSREQPRTKPATVVAPATRSTSSNKIKLKQSQVQVAKKLGITPEQYVKEFLKLEAQNG